MESLKSNQEAAEFTLIYTQSFYNFCRIDLLKEYIREDLPNELLNEYKEHADILLDAREKILSYSPGFSDALKRIEGVAKQRAIKDIENEYGPLPEPDEEYIRKVATENPLSFLKMLACGVAFQNYEVMARKMKTQGNPDAVAKCEENKENAISMMTLYGNKMHLHGNEIVKAVGDYANALLDSNDTKGIQYCLDLFHALEKESSH